MLIIYLRFIKDLKNSVSSVVKTSTPCLHLANALPPSSQRLPSMQPTPSLHAANALPIFYKFRSSPPNISPAKPPELLGFLLPLTRFYNVNIPYGKEKEKNPHQPPGHPPYRLRNSCRNRLLLPSVSTVSSGPHRLRIHRPRRHSRLHI